MEMDEDVDENVGEELDDVYFQTCEARVCQSVHTEGRDPRLQLVSAERAFCKPYSAAPQHMQGQCIHSLNV